MIEKQKTASKGRARTAKRSARPNRPFDPKVLKRAGGLANKYRLVLEPNKKLGWIGRAVELSGIIADGKTADDCVRNTRTALKGAIATMIELGQVPPSPEVGRRTVQVNIRVTADEKFLLERAARNAGYSGISALVRFAAILYVSHNPAIKT